MEYGWQACQQLWLYLAKALGWRGRHGDGVRSGTAGGGGGGRRALRSTQHLCVYTHPSFLLFSSESSPCSSDLMGFAGVRCAGGEQQLRHRLSMSNTATTAGPN